MRKGFWITAVALIASASLAQEAPAEDEASPPSAQEESADEPAPVALEEAVSVTPAAPLATGNEGDGSEPSTEPVEQPETAHEQQEPDDESAGGGWRNWLFLSDGFAQWIMACAAIIGVFLTIYAVVLLRRTWVQTGTAAEYAKRTLAEARHTTRVSLVGVRAAQRSAEVAREANEIARQAYVSDFRPWVGVVGERIDRLTIDAMGARIYIVLTLKNVGRTPANNLAIKARFETKPSVQEIIEEVRRHFLARRKSDPDEMASLFPEEPGEKEVNVTCPFEDLPHTRGGGVSLIFTLSGFVTYKFGTDEAAPIYGTSFVYRVARKPSQPIVWNGEPLTIPGTDLQIVRWPDARGWMAD